MPKTIVSLFVIGTLSAAVIYSTNAFFSDAETSTGNTFTAGSIDLKINNQDDPSSIVTLNDLKPGDDRFVDKDLYVDFNPAKIWLHIISLEASQSAQTEPEEQEENGTPKFDIQNYITYDLKISSPSASTIIDFTDSILLPDAVSCWIPIATIPGATHVTLQQSFHFDSQVTNWAQGDSLTFTEEFLAQQINDPSIPDTGSGRIWDPEQRKCVPNITPTPTNTPTPTPIACTPVWASSVVASNQGLRKNTTAVLAIRSNPVSALVSQSVGSAFDTPIVEGTFFSLGFPLNQTPAGSITVQFTSPVLNTIGPDLKIFEVTGGPPYPDEKVTVEVSPDNITYTNLGTVTKDAALEMIIPSAQYVRITEASNIALFESTADGFDLDGVQALCGSVN